MSMKSSKQKENCKNMKIRLDKVIINELKYKSVKNEHESWWM